MGRTAATCFLVHILVFVSSVAGGDAAAEVHEGGGHDLPADAALRVGVTYRPRECPRRAQNGDRIAIEFTGSLFKDRSVFDSSVWGDPFHFTVGAGQVIKGLDQGLLGSCLGETRKLVIPSAMAYGSRGAGPAVPPHSSLVYQVELVAFGA